MVPPRDRSSTRQLLLSLHHTHTPVRYSASFSLGCRCRYGTDEARERGAHLERLLLDGTMRRGGGEGASKYAHSGAFEVRSLTIADIMLHDVAPVSTVVGLAPSSAHRARHSHPRIALLASSSSAAAFECIHGVGEHYRCSRVSVPSGAMSSPSNEDCIALDNAMIHIERYGRSLARGMHAQREE
jgi:hypothetical protein